MNNIKRDEKYTDDFWTPIPPEGETEEEFIKRCHYESKVLFGIDFDYEKIKESKAYKLLFEGFDEWVASHESEVTLMHQNNGQYIIYLAGIYE